VTVVFVHKDIVYSISSVGRFQRTTAHTRLDSLRWFSRGARVGGAKVKLCIWAVCGNSGRPVVSGGISSLCHSKPSQGEVAVAGAVTASSGVVGCPLMVRLCAVVGEQPIEAGARQRSGIRSPLTDGRSRGNGQIPGAKARQDRAGQLLR
jgi:hypothetical protein